METQRECIGKIKENIRRVIIGKEETVNLLLTTLVAGGHVLLEDVPGTGKTVLAKSLAKSINGEFSRIQFTPDLLPADVTGLTYYNQKEGKFIFKKGPAFCNVLLADEINRATPRTQSSLLECMEEHQITVDGVTYPLKRPFFVAATENPVETLGTFPLPEAQMDRFFMRLSMGMPTAGEELQILERFEKAQPLEELQPVCSCGELESVMDACRSVYVHPELKRYLVEITGGTREYPDVVSGVSPRGTLALFAAVRAHALVCGREYAVPEDVKAVAVPVLAHRLIMSRGISGAVGGKQVIEAILEKVPVPTEKWTGV